MLDRSETGYVYTRVFQSRNEDWRLSSFTTATLRATGVETAGARNVICVCDHDEGTTRVSPTMITELALKNSPSTVTEKPPADGPLEGLSDRSRGA